MDLIWTAFIAFTVGHIFGDLKVFEKCWRVFERGWYSVMYPDYFYGRYAKEILDAAEKYKCMPHQIMWNGEELVPNYNIPKWRQPKSYADIHND